MPPNDLTVNQLMERCADESDRFRQRLSHDPVFCLELLRRAIEEDDGDAWLAFVVQYEQLARQQLNGLDELAQEELLMKAFTKFSNALRARALASFPTWAAVITYLLSVVTTARIDHFRHQKVERRGLETLRRQLELQQERDLVGELDNRKIIERIRSHLKTDQEKLVFELRYEMDMLPAEMSARFPAQLTSVDEIEKVLGRIKKRLERDIFLQERLAGF